MSDYQAPLRVPQIQPDSRRARHSMPSLPTGEGQDSRGTKQPIDASQLGTRDAGEITLNRKGLFVKKTNEELIDDIRRAGQAIDENWDWAFPIGKEVDIFWLLKIESHANALAIYCKLLRQRLEAQQPTLTERD